MSTRTGELSVVEIDMRLRDSSLRLDLNRADFIRQRDNMVISMLRDMPVGCTAAALALHEHDNKYRNAPPKMTKVAVTSAKPRRNRASTRVVDTIYLAGGCVEQYPDGEFFLHLTRSVILDENGHT